MSRRAPDFDRCKDLSRALALELRALGVDARWVQVAGLVAPAPHADERWDEVPAAHRLHYVVQAGGVVIDLTPLQFWPDGPSPLVERDYLKRWAAHHDVTSALTI